MHLIPVSAVADNCLWRVPDGDRAVAVNLGNGAPGLRVAAPCDWPSDPILITHPHTGRSGCFHALGGEGPGLLPAPMAQDPLITLS